MQGTDDEIICDKFGHLVDVRALNNLLGKGKCFLKDGIVDTFNKREIAN